ncbi:MAG: hypothetical protein DMF68_02490, partial [Acidobacteria bacterium]
KNHLMISGIVVAGINPSAIKTNEKTEAGAPPQQPSTAAGAATKAEGEDVNDPQPTPAVRKFNRGMIVQYNYVIYDAQLDKATKLPQLQTQLRIFREGRPVFTGRVLPFNPANQTDMKRLIAGGALQLGAEMTPGEYILQIVVTDPLAKDKYRVATQWIDFEIVK